MKPVQIDFNAAWAKMYNVPDSIREKIKTQLTYIDASIEYNNKRSRYTKVLEDPSRCLLIDDTFYTGLLTRVDWVLRNAKIERKYNKTIESITPIKLELPDWLYAHQVEMIERALVCKRGIIQSPTGSGKTIAMAQLIRHFPVQTTLITVPNKDLLRQTSKVIEDIIGEKVGQIGDGKKTIKRVTVGIINSLSKISKSNPEVLRGFDVLICDEVHRVGANFYRDLCEVLLNTDYRIGFSATAWRERGDNKVLEGLIGPIALTIKEERLTRNNILVSPIYTQIPFDSPKLTYSHYQPLYNTYNTSNGKPERAEVYHSCIVHCDARNKMIVDLIDTYLKSDPELPALVLVELIEHGDILKEMFEEVGIELDFVHGKTKKAERIKLIEDLRDRKIKVAVASRIFNEGQDIPCLGLGIIAGGGSSTSRLIQQVGRFVRSYTSDTLVKKKAVIIDFNDTEEMYLSYNSRRRKRAVAERYKNCEVRLSYEQLKDHLREGLDSF